MEQQATPSVSTGKQVVIKKEFVCDPKMCAEAGYKFKIGKTVASGLSGFIAGVAVASIILLPWLFVMGKICPSQVLR